MTSPNRRLWGGLAGITASVAGGLFAGSAISNSQEQIAQGRDNAQSCLEFLADETQSCDLDMLNIDLGSLALGSNLEKHDDRIILSVVPEDVQAAADKYIASNPEAPLGNSAVIAGSAVTSIGLIITACMTVGTIRRKFSGLLA